MPEIVLTTLNARYAHASFGLRYLKANLRELESRAKILEFEISQRPVDVLEAVLACEPKIVGVGVYIWNVDQATRLVADLKRVRPGVTVIIGGPEVSHEIDEQPITRLADYVVTGEGDLAFRELCGKLLNQERPLIRVIDGGAPKMEDVELPYRLYDDVDISQRVIYVEASRGCPFSCEFCLSSLDVPVRQVELQRFLKEMDALFERGVRNFKFVDRTFNLNLSVGRAILEFFKARIEPGLFLHFEMIPDRLPEQLREPIAAFPPGMLQFEVGIQTLNDEVGARISRRQNVAKAAENLRWLRENTGVHIHADLIVGLPGEDIKSFGAGFDRLLAMGPQEIQVGMLKRLRGTPISRHDKEWGMSYSPYAPYEVLQTSSIGFLDMQRMRRFARFWDMIGNSGNFKNSLPLIWEGGSPFDGFMVMSDWLFSRAGATHGIALARLAQLLFEYLTTQRMQSPARVASLIGDDYVRGGRNEWPEFLRSFRPDLETIDRAKTALPRRQARHLK